jgi:hypothetical protein
MTGSRDDGSGIRCFRVPPGLSWPTEAGPNIEIIRHGHRYAVAPPSVHPHTGATYRWIGPDGTDTDPPRPGDLPELPAAWVAYLTGTDADGHTVGSKPGSRAATRKDRQGGREWLATLPAGDPCSYVAKMAADLRAAAGREDGSAYDHTRNVVMALLRAAERGHHGAVGVLAHGRKDYVATAGKDRGERTAEAEFDRFTESGAAKVLAAPAPEAGRGCDCVDEWLTTIDAPPASATGDVPPAEETPALTLTDELAANPRLREVVVDLQNRQRAREIVALLEERKHPKPPPDAGTLAELLARPETARWRIDGLLPASGRLLLSAQRKTGKTTAVGNLARSLLTGEPFLGRFEVTKLDGRVVVLNYEVTGETFARWMDDIGVPHDRLYVVNLRGRRNLLADEEGRTELAELVRAQDGEVLAVDPFGRAFTGKSQNDTGEVTPWLGRLDEVAETAGVTELILTAHAGWDGERTRGSSALEDWPDSIVTMTRDPDTDQRFIKAEGRDVDVDEDRLDYDQETRHLSLSGAGNRKQVRATEHIEQLAAAVRDIVTEQPGINTSKLAESLRDGGEHLQREDTTAAVRLAESRGWVIRQSGPRNSKQHFPGQSSRVVPESSRGQVVSSPDPSYKDGTTDTTAEAMSSPGRDYWDQFVLDSDVTPPTCCVDCGWMTDTTEHTKRCLSEAAS